MGLSISDKTEVQPLATVPIEEQPLVALSQAVDSDTSDLFSHHPSANLDMVMQSESQETDGQDQSANRVTVVDEHGVPIPNPLNLDPLRDEYDEALKPTYASLPRLE